MLAEATARKMVLHPAGPGIFNVGDVRTNDLVMVSVNHDDGFMVARRWCGTEPGQFGRRRWKRLGFWKTPAPAVRVASMFTSHPVYRKRGTR